MSIFFQHAIDHALNFNRLTGVVADLAVPGTQHLVEMAEVAPRQRQLLGQKDFAGGGITPLLQCCQQYSGEVDKAHAGAAITPFSADGGFDAADRRIIIGILRFHAQLDKLRNHYLIVVEGRHAKPTADHLHAGIEKVAAHPGMVTNAEVGLGRTQATAGLQNGIGQRVHRVAG
ncbi:Uncharacterised protein [Providencia rustigianii]|nr:Uncharacterised protein [Providencia rustigianii]